VRIVLTERRLAEAFAGAGLAVVDIETLLSGEVDLDGAGPPAITHPNAVCYVVATSGSTGLPKSVMLSNRNCVTRELGLIDEFGLTGDDHLLAHASFSHFWPLAVGARVVIGERDLQQSILNAASTIVREGIRVIHMVPSALEVLATTRDFGNCTTLRHIFSTGEAISMSSLRAIQEIVRSPVHILYGQTETSYATTATVIPGQAPSANDHGVLIGRPYGFARAYILDAHNQMLPVGVPGEICVGGAGVAVGYVGMPEETNSRFIHDPYAGSRAARLYRTGDVGRYRADGAIEFLGRRDRQVKIRGYRVELSEVELALAQHPGVRQCTVMLGHGANDAPALIAYFTAWPSTAADVRSVTLRSFLRQRLPEYMVPAAFQRLQSLPLTASGKVDRNALPPPDWAPMPAEHADWVLDNVERDVLQIWKDVLSIDQVSPLDDFFDLGGQSISLLELMVRVKQHFGVSIEMANVLQASTIRTLSELIRHRVAQMSEGGRP
jgi:amino acid adenylation domain-containing protein